MNRFRHLFLVLQPGTSATAAILTAFLFLGSTAEAQNRRSISGDAKERAENICRNNASRIRQGSLDSTGLAALRSLIDCPDAGPDQIAERILSRPSNAAYAAELRNLSRWLNDRRIANAALSILGDAAAPRQLRYIALDILASQLSPALRATFGRKDVPTRSALPPNQVIGTTSIPVGEVGLQPFHMLGRDPVDDATRVGN